MTRRHAATPRVKPHARALPLRVGTRGSPLALVQTRGFLDRADPVLPGAAQYGRVRGTCHPHHRRRGAGSPPGGYRRQGAVRQGDPRGAGRRPHRLRGAQPEGPGDRAAARHRARLHAATRGCPRCADPRTATATTPIRPIRSPACPPAPSSAPPPSAARRSCCTHGRTCDHHAARQRADPARQAGRRAPARPRCSPMRG